MTIEVDVLQVPDGISLEDELVLRILDQAHDESITEQDVRDLLGELLWPYETPEQANEALKDGTFDILRLMLDSRGI